MFLINLYTISFRVPPYSVKVFPEFKIKPTKRKNPREDLTEEPPNSFIFRNIESQELMNTFFVSDR